MISGTGSATLDFGTGSNETQVFVAVPEITAACSVEAFVMADDTSADHTANDHKYFGVFAALTCGTPTEASGFTIYARSTQKMTGKWSIRYVWAD